MSTIIQGHELRSLLLGRYVQGKTSDFTTGGDATYQVFTVAGGEVYITALWGLVTTVVAEDGGTIALAVDPTTGDTTTIVTATDLGTTNTLAGDVIGIAIETNDTANNQTNFAVNGAPLGPLVVSTGEIEVAGASSVDGVVEWYATYVPLTPGATLVAAA
jgi:hypothetical protein